MVENEAAQAAEETESTAAAEETEAAAKETPKEAPIKSPKPKKAKKEQLYHIHSTVRDVATRLHRAQSPTRHRFKQMLGGGVIRLVRKRPAVVTEGMVKRLMRELVEKEQMGILKVTLPTGQRVELPSLKIVEELPPTPPEKKAPDLTVDGDETFEHGVGQHMPQADQEGGVAQDAELTPPAVLSQELPEGKAPVETEAPVIGGDVPEIDVEAPVEDLDAITQGVYDAFSMRQLKEMASDWEVVDVSGNKMDVARRLVEAGFRLEG